MEERLLRIWEMCIRDSRKPFDVPHTYQSLNELAGYLGTLDGDTRIVMECTGRYHEPMLKACLLYTSRCV